MNDSQTKTDDANKALERLLAGNTRFATSKLTHPDQTDQHRTNLLAGQHPFAVILGCSDSRIPPEIIFDQGLGDIFVIRVAGNVLDDIVLGSIEYAVAHLHTPLVMVLGHSACGAVGAALSGDEFEEHIMSIAGAITPALESVKDLSENSAEEAAKANARWVAKALGNAKPVLAELHAAGKIKIVAAYYDQVSGRVEVLES